MESTPESYVVVIPFYNGLHTILELVSRIRKMGSWKVIVVDDAGVPEKGEKLNTILSGIPETEVLHLSTNLGQHIATYVGMLHTHGQHVITMDEDLQFLPEDIPKLIAHFKSGKADVVYGCTPKQGLSDLFRASVLGIIKPQMANVYPKETSSFRIIRNSLVERLCKTAPAFIQLEGMIMQHVKAYGYVDVEKGAARPNDSAGSYNILSLYRMVVGLVKYYTLFPMRLFSVVIIILSVFFLYQKNEIGFVLAPISVFCLFNILGDRKIILARKALNKEQLFRGWS